MYYSRAVVKPLLHRMDPLSISNEEITLFFHHLVINVLKTTPYKSYFLVVCFPVQSPNLKLAKSWKELFKYLAEDS